ADNTAPATFTVTNTLDDGSAGSLRWAIEQVNANIHSLSTIDFNIPGSGVQSIALASPLSAIIHPVVIDGFSQPGSSANTLPLTGTGAGDNGVRLIDIQGGLTIAGGNSTVNGLTLSGGGVSITANGNDLVTGIAASGVSIDVGVNNNTIGG